MLNERKPLIRVEHLHKDYPARAQGFQLNRDLIHAVNDVSFELFEGETLGLVGESGCGKSTVGRQLVGLEKPTSGKIFYQSAEGELDLAQMTKKQSQAIRQDLQMIFQDSTASLNPRKHIFELLAAPLLYNGLETKQSVEKRVDELLNMVGLPSSSKGRYPHEFSGGQRQRIGIARALSLNPRFIVCDEPVSALDASIQAQVLNLLKSLQQELNLTYLFIGHGLASVHYLSQRIAVMYLGKIVEIGEASEVFRRPVHPYTQALVKASPMPNPRRREEEKHLLQGEIPSNIHLPQGCPFHPRCPKAKASCRTQTPSLALSKAGQAHWVACPIALEEET